MAVIKTKKGYKSTKTGKIFSSQGKAISADKGGSSSQTREEQLNQIENTALKIQAGIKSSADSFTPEQRTQLSQGLTQASEELTKKTKPQIPLATEIKRLPAYTAPTTVPTLGNVTEATAATKGLQAQQQIIQKYKDEQLTRAQELEKNQKSLWDVFSKDIVSPRKAREEAWNETGIDVQEHFAKTEGIVKEIEALDQQYNSIVAAKDQQIAQANDKMASMNFINNQVAQIERNAAPQLNRLSSNINAKAATLQALQGNFSEARAYVNQAVQDATAETKFKYEMYREMYELNQDSFDRMSGIYKEAYSTQMAIAQQEYNEQLAEKELIGEYMLKYPKAGLTMQDSLEDASRKLASLPETGGKVDLTADMKNYYLALDQGYEGTFADWVGKGGGAQANYIQVMQDAVNQGASPEEAARAAANVSEAEGIPVDQTTLSSWIRAASKLSPAKMGPTETISAPSGTYSTGQTQGPTLTSIWNSLFGD